MIVYPERAHSSRWAVNPAYTVLLQQQQTNALFPPVWVTFVKNYNAQLLKENTEPFVWIKQRICDLFLKIYVVSRNCCFRSFHGICLQ